MASLRMRLVLIIIGLLFPLPQSFVIRKRSAGYDFMNRKSDWMVERPDDLLTDMYPRRYGSGLDDEKLALDMLLDRPQDYYDDEDEEPGSDGGRGLSMGPVTQDEEEDEEEEEEEEGGGAKLVDKSELEDLFGKTSDGKRKTLTSKEPEVTSSKSELTKEAVERLLNPEEKNEVRKVVTETKIVVSASNGSDNVPSYEGVRVVEVAEKDSNGGTRRQKQTQWLMGPEKDAERNGNDVGGEMERTIASSWLGDVLNEARKEEEGGSRTTRKVKRSELSTNDDINDEVVPPPPPSPSNRDDVELLKEYIRLQTEENRHLQKALNLAISTQVENTDEFLGDEVGQLRMAVENEEALDTIRKAIRLKQREEEEDEEEEEEIEEDDKTGEGEEEEEEEQEEMDGNGVDDEDDEFSKQLLKAKLKKFLIDTAVKELKDGNYEDDGVDEEEEEEEEEENGEDEEEQDEGDQRTTAKVLNPFTRNALVEYGKFKRTSGYDGVDQNALLRATNDLDLTDLLETPDSSDFGYCPAVDELTDNCLVARRDGLVLDAEATSLCNRHQICYICGSAFGMTSATCDRGYLGESELLCSGKKKCVQEAADLYLLIMKAHQFIPTSELSSYVCSALCVYDYIVGQSEDRRR